MPDDVAKYRQITDCINNVNICGFVPNGKLHNYFAASDLLVMPYQKEVSVSSGMGSTSEWMSPMKMFEYMAARRPIISSDLPVLREVLRHEENAILIDPLDIEKWVQQIIRLRYNAELRQKLSQKAWEDVAEKYTWDKRVQNIFSKLNFK